MREVSADAAAPEESVDRAMCRQARPRLVGNSRSNPGGDAGDDRFRIGEPCELLRREGCQLVRFRIAARPKVDETIVVAAAARRCTPGQCRGISKGESARPDVEQVRSPAVRRWHFHRLDRRAVESDVEHLVHPVAGGGNLQGELRIGVDLELELC